MKLFLFLTSVVIASAQNLPVVNTITTAGVTCTFTVVDSLLSVSTDCVSVADGVILDRRVTQPSAKGAILGTGPIMCVYGISGTAVKLQCLTDDGVTSPKITLDGTLVPPAAGKVRQWWVFWK